MREMWAKIGSEKAKTMTPVRPRSRTHMAHPAEPWPFGMVIRLKSPSHSSGGYLIWVGGIRAGSGRVIRMSDGEGKIIHADDLHLYEPVSEPDV